MISIPENSGLALNRIFLKIIVDQQVPCARKLAFENILLLDIEIKI